jgi:hypothetical protein
LGTQHSLLINRREHAALSVTDGCRYGAVMGNSRFLYVWKAT